MNAPAQKPAKTPTATIVRNDAMTPIYVEGVSQMMVGFPNSRLLLLSYVERSGDPQNPHEMHHVACELIMPTSAVIELAQNLINNLSANKELLKQARTEWSGKVATLFDALGSVPVAETATPKKPGD